MLWDGDCFEVIAAESRPDGGVQYLLAAWEASHAIRRAERYDDESESERSARRNQAGLDRRTRGILVALMFFTGQLPNDVQQRWELDYAFPAVMATLSSAIPLGILGMAGTILLMAMLFGAGFGIPVGGSMWLVVCPYLLVVSGIRIESAAGGRPMGTPAGTFGFLLWRGLRRAGIIGRKSLF